MKWRRPSVAAMVLMTPLLLPALAMAQGAVTATLSVLTAPGERIAGDGGAPEPGVEVNQVFGSLTDARGGQR